MTDIAHIIANRKVKAYQGTAEEQIRNCMLDNGINPPDNIQIPTDGFKRFSKSGNGSGKLPRYYRFDIVEGVTIGCFGCWSDDTTIPFRENVGRELSIAEKMSIERAKANLEEQRKRLKQESIANIKESLKKDWPKFEEAPPDHGYLTTKGIKAHNCKMDSDFNLLLPLYDIDKELTGYQKITPNGKKQNLKGAPTHNLVSPLEGRTDTIFIATGLSTSASINESTGRTTLAVIGDSNLAGGCEYALRHYPNSKIVVVADNDSDKEKNSGAMAAEKCKSLHTRVNTIIIPQPGQDANDFANSGGDLKALLLPNEPAKVDDNWLVSALDFCKQPAPIKWFVKGWLQREALMMVHGPSGGGKTFCVLDWCLRIASGVDHWHGSKVRPGSVAYLAGEGHLGLRGRVAAWVQEHAPEEVALWLSKSGCNLNTPEGFGQAVESLDDMPSQPDLIVVDTLHRFLDGDENSSKDAKTMLDACAGLIDRYQCAVLLVHHTGVSEEAQHRARGSSAWRGALDIEISITPKDDVIQVSQRKNKDSEAAENVFLELKKVTLDGWIDEDGDQVSSAIVTAGEAPLPKEDSSNANQKFLKMFSDCWLQSGKEMSEQGDPYLTKSAIIDYLLSQGINQSSANQYVKPSVKSKLIGSLLNSGSIVEYQYGWALIDQHRKQQLILAK